uniref:Pseudouridylate synthase 1 homolog n=1 Tax=Parascaris univalens TaxID=6257 RepID=A0A915BXU2_PARUN
MIKFLIRISRLVMAEMKDTRMEYDIDASSKVIIEKIEKRPHPSTSNDNGEPMKKRWKKRIRYAMLIAYQGKNYCGMQIQKDAPTIEGCLLNAMQNHGLITEEEVIKPNLFFFQRAARTDRAVSAVRQVCSMMLNFDEQLPKTVPDELNRLLPEDIRVMGIRRATRTFNAQKDCDARTYSYTLPTYAFAKVDELTSSAYRISDETINEINALLGIFVGTHNFFNYTSKREFSDKSCFRYIMDFKCGPKFLFKNELRNEHVEFLTILIKGQSFMLHQIRKMIGMVIAISRGLLYKSDIQRSFESIRMDVPKAPGLGLLLEKVHYDHYDKKFAKTHEKLGDWGEEIEAKISDVRQRLIVNEILQQEISTQSMMNWLSDLVKHDFTVSPEDEDPPRKSPLSLASAVAAAVKEMMESVAADGVIPNCAKNAIEQATLEGKDSKEIESEKQTTKESGSVGDCASGEDRGSEGNVTGTEGSNHGSVVDTPL